MARTFRLKFGLPSLLVLCFCVPALPATVGNKVASRSAEAAEAYSGGAFDEALRLYRDAQLEAPDSPALHYNVGDALYKLEQYDAAAEEFKRAAAGEQEDADPVLSAGSWYNLGNTLFQQQQYPQAVQAYKNALLQDSADMEAKANLEMALEKVEEEQQQQQREDGEGEEEESQQQQGQQQSPEDGEQQPEPQQSESQDQEQPQAESQDGKNHQPLDEEAGEMDEMEAEQLLEALRDREIEAQRRRFRVVPRGRTHDW